MNCLIHLSAYFESTLRTMNEHLYLENLNIGLYYLNTNEKELIKACSDPGT